MDEGMKSALSGMMARSSVLNLRRVGSTTGRVVQSVRRIFDFVRDKMGEDDLAERSGAPAAFFYLADRSTKREVCFSWVGDQAALSSERAHRYRTNATEKVNRLLLRDGDVSTFQSRKIEADPPRYGGGIAVGGFAFALSGLTEHADESVCLLLAVHQGYLVADEAMAIAQLSNNLFFIEVLAEARAEGFFEAD